MVRQIIIKIDYTMDIIMVETTKQGNYVKTLFIGL